MSNEVKDHAFMGKTVTRRSGDHKGRVGVIVDLNLTTHRARVKWDNGPRTWVSWSDLIISG